MKFLRSRWGYLAIAGSLVVAVLGRVVLQRMARPQPWFTYSMSPLSRAGYEALAARPGWAASSLRMADGVMLSGLVSRPARKDAPWVLFFPGNDATQLSRGQLLLERVRGSHNWGLAVYASRGFDSSQGTPSPSGFAEDGINTFQGLLKSEQLRPSQVHVVAFSLGGYGAVKAVGQTASESAGSLSLLASIAKIAMVHPGFRASLTTGDVYDLVPFLESVRCPTLIVQGTADEAFGNVEQGRTIAAQLGERAHYLELQGAGHNSLLENQAAILAVRSQIEGSEPKN